MSGPDQLVKTLTHHLIQPALGRVFPGLQLTIRWHQQLYLSKAWGSLDPSLTQPTQLQSRFDCASLTKLVTALAFMRLVEAGLVALNQPVQSVLSDFKGHRPIQPYEDPLNPGHWITLSYDPTPVDAATITFRQLLTHTSGLPAWRPLYTQPNATLAKAMALKTHFAYQPETHLCYSDIGFILLGLAIEQLTQLSLDQALTDLVIQPLGLTQTSFNPSIEASQMAPTEWCLWRQHRIRGIVHDENAYRLGGVAGHAGIFSTAPDMAQLGQWCLTQVPPLLKAETMMAMTTPQVSYGSIRRGLGFALRVNHPQASSLAFSNQAFGHTGFTGTSLWIDPDRALVVACLSNSLYYGRDRDDILMFRVQLHQAIVNALDHL